jgi:FkbM family methyltransferase
MCFPYFLHGCIPHETSESEILKRLTREGDLFIDAGANMGFYTALARRWVGSSGMVISFEPNPACVDLMRRSFASDSNVMIVPCALGKEIGTGDLRVPRQGDLATLDYPARNADTILKVNIVTLDSFLAERRLPTPCVVKVDCEGMECAVMQGMESLLKTTRPPAIAFEYIDELARRFGVNLSEIMDYIQETSSGAYEFFRVDYGGKLRSRDLFRPTAQNDLVAVPSWRRRLVEDLLLN